MQKASQMKVENLDHLGLIAGLIDEIGIVGSPEFMVYTVSGTTVRDSVTPGRVRICGLLITTNSGEPNSPKNQ